jgi:hypothetical protein
LRIEADRSETLIGKLERFHAGSRARASHTRTRGLFSLANLAI